MKIYDISFDSRILNFIDLKYWQESMGRIDDLYDMNKHYDYCQQFQSYNVPNLERFQMESKPTRVLDPFHSVGLVVENTLLDFITQFSLPKHSIHPIKFIYRGKWKENYRYLLFEENMFYHVDFKKSLFKVKDHYKDEWRFQKFDTLEDCIEFTFLENTRCINNSLILKESTSKYDFFYFRWNGNYYCNERFMNASIENDHKDISFREVPENSSFNLRYEGD